MRKNNKKPLPPPWVDRFLQWRLPKEQFEEVQGDMHELYGQWVEEMGVKKARWMYLLNAFTFLRPLPTRKSTLYQPINHYQQTNLTDMLANYLLMSSF